MVIMHCQAKALSFILKAISESSAIQAAVMQALEIPSQFDNWRTTCN
jgi:hypothetical protein